MTSRSAGHGDVLITVQEAQQFVDAYRLGEVKINSHLIGMKPLRILPAAREGDDQGPLLRQLLAQLSGPPHSHPCPAGQCRAAPRPAGWDRAVWIGPGTRRRQAELRRRSSVENGQLPAPVSPSSSTSKIRKQSCLGSLGFGEPPASSPGDSVTNHCMHPGKWYGLRDIRCRGRRGTGQRGRDGNGSRCRLLKEWVAKNSLWLTPGWPEHPIHYNICICGAKQTATFGARRSTS